MRLRDYANRYVKNVGEYQIIKVDWEKQVSIFKHGICVHTVRQKDEAIKWCDAHCDGV